MNILKARIKSFEDMPPDAKCCIDNNEAMKAYNSTEVELNPIPTETRSICPWCGHINVGLGFNYMNGKFSLRADMIDIDEGQLN